MCAVLVCLEFRVGLILISLIISAVHSFVLLLECVCQSACNSKGLQKLTGSTCLTFSPLEKGLTASAQHRWSAPEKVPSWCHTPSITGQPQPSNVAYIQSVCTHTQMHTHTHKPWTLTVITWALTFTFYPSGLFYTVTNIFTFTSSLLRLSQRRN